MDDEKRMENVWTDSDRYKVALLLRQRFPLVAIDDLMAAICECEHEVKRENGWDALADCAAAHLKKRLGAGDSAADVRPQHR